MTSTAEDLGLFAARCEIYSIDQYLTDRERELLLLRADRYRDLQLVALADPYFVSQAAASRVMDAMSGVF